jgi:hypothetical protein
MCTTYLKKKSDIERIEVECNFEEENSENDIFGYFIK